MRSRTDILKDLLYFKGNLPSLREELSQYPWDTEEAYLLMTKKHFLNVISRCLKDEISLQDLEVWANLIECRDDLDFENEELQEIVFELASPEINGAITRERLHEIIKNISE